MNPQDAATANAIAQAVVSSLAPLLVKAVGASALWAIWMTWTVRSTKQTVDGFPSQLHDIDTQLDAVEETLENHRREDGENFSELYTHLGMKRPSHFSH